MKRCLVLAFIGLLVISLLVANYWFGDHHGHERLSANGIIEATEVDLSSKIAGRIREIRVREGDDVKMGQILVRLEDDDLKALVKQYEASLQAAEANVEETKAKVEEASQDLMRKRNLFREGLLSKAALDDAEMRYQVNSAQYGQAKAQVEQAKALLATARLKLEDSVIQSPIAGRVLHKNFEEGEFVSPGERILTLADLEHLWVRVYVPEEEVGRVHYGQKADVAVDSFPGVIFQGQVGEIGTKAEFTPKNVQTKRERVNLVFGVKIFLDNPDLRLKPGVPADAVISF